MPLWIELTQWIGRLVLLVLIALSVWSFSIIIERYRFFLALRDSENLSSLKNAWFSLSPSELKEKLEDASVPVLAQGILRGAFSISPAQSEAIDRSIRSYLTEQRGKMEKGLTVLATLGSNSPFIGLFGTVLGIIQAFGELSLSNRGASAVTAGISEALIATAAGLFVAIPAVIAYNVYSRKIRVLLSESDSFKDFLLSRILSS